MQRYARPLAAGLLAGVALIAPSTTASAKSPDFVVVDTQFWDAPSTIVDSGGAFEGCTEVNDFGGTAEQIKPNTAIFIGDKEIICPGGEVEIHYVATLNGSGKRTSGHWFVTSSTLPGVTEGFGTVRGDTRCEIAEGSEGCILDTFAGETG